MGALWTSLALHGHANGHANAAAALRLSEQDALALCEDGDLLLARDSLEHRALRLRLELAVARDVGRVQRGRFPRQLATELPAWTSCELLERHNGHLHALRVRADSVHLTPFRYRIRGGGDGNRFAIRRLQRGVSTALLRQLGEELAPVAPFRWQQLLEKQADAPGAPPRRQQTPPLLASVLSRALELWKASVLSSRHPKEPIDSPRAVATTTDAGEMKDVDASDAVGMLNAALVAAVYERLGVLSLPPLEASGRSLLPTSFASASTSHNSSSGTVDSAAGNKLMLVQLTPLDALGSEMRLVVSQQQAP